MVADFFSFKSLLVRASSRTKPGLSNTGLNGMNIYTSLYAASKNSKITVDKSISSRRLSAGDSELSALLEMNK